MEITFYLAGDFLGNFDEEDVEALAILSAELSFLFNELTVFFFDEVRVLAVSRSL